MKEINSHYQTFDFLGQISGPNTSKIKFENSNLDKQNYENKKILDVGCNDGYFLFRTYNMDNTITGIGIDKVSIDNAVSIKDSYFPNSNITFKQVDVFDYKNDEKFDIIFVFSVFHYFVDKQKVFIDKCYDMLKSNGIVYLEVEEYPDSSECIIKKIARPADNCVLDYPTEMQVNDWVKNKFNIIEKNHTYLQAGSMYKRFCYKLKKNI